MSYPVDKLEDRYQTIAPTDADIIEGKHHSIPVKEHEHGLVTVLMLLLFVSVFVIRNETQDRRLRRPFQDFCYENETRCSCK